MMEVERISGESGKKTPPIMAKSETDMGINSWLEEELYQQYLHDRSTVDESWKHVFEEPGGRPSNGGPGTPALPSTTPPPSAPLKPLTAAAAPPDSSAQAELQPLRGVAGRIAENM